MQTHTKEVLAALANRGLLLLQDKRLPNVVTLVTGETLKGSWWSHAKSHLVFAVLSELGDHPDVLLVKLVQGKVTLVHRELWPALLAIVSKREPWQLRGLSASARRLLDEVSESRQPLIARGPAVKELEVRLLVHSREIHTESGRHALAVEAWPLWAKPAGVRPLRSVAAAKRQLEEAVTRIGAEPSMLPWPVPRQ